MTRTSKKNAPPWSSEHFDEDANMAQFSKPVIVVTSKATLVVWRTRKAQPKLRLATYRFAP